MGWNKGEKYFRANAVIVREVNGLRIVFYNQETIYVQDENKQWTIFHRWFAPRGSYNAGWRPFRYKLLYQKKLDINHCYRLAFQHDISVQRAIHAPDMSKFKTEVRF